MSYGGRNSHDWIMATLDVVERIKPLGDGQFFISDDDSDILNDVERYADTIRAELAALVEAAGAAAEVLYVAAQASYAITSEEYQQAYTTVCAALVPFQEGNDGKVA